MTSKRFIQIGIAFAGILILLSYFFGLFIDTTGDAGKYAAISRHIVESGDWINLKIHGEPYEQKPPLLMWLSALGFKLGGLNNWSFKLFPSMAGLWFAYKLGESLYNKRTGQLAAIMLGTSWVYFMFTMDVHTDLVLQTNVTLAIWQLSEYLKTKKASNFIWAFVGVGLAMMTKGPVGGAVPAFALGTHMILKRDFKQLFHPKWLIGIAIALIICLPAFVGLVNQFGAEGIKFFFITNNIGRITGSYIGTNNDYFFYVHSLLYLVLPWTFLFLFGFYHEFKSYFRTSWKDREYLTTGGIWIFFLIISIAKGKAPHYVFMLIPMMLVVVGHWIDHFLSLNEEKILRRLNRFQIAMVIIIAFLLILIQTYIFPSNRWYFWLVLILSATSVFITYKKSFSFQTKLFLPAVTMMAAFILFLNAHALPQAYSYQVAREVSELYNEKADAGDPLYNYLYPSFEVFFYSNNADAKWLDSINDFQPDEQRASWFYTNEAGKDSITGMYGQENMELYPFFNRGMNRISPGFLNPVTREASLKPMFLIRLKPEDGE